MAAISSASIRRVGAKGLAVACASCAFGLGLMILVFGLGPSAQRDSVTDEKNSPPKRDPKKAEAAWNVALGNLVVIAPELGFDVKSPKNTTVELSRINAKIEAQLMPVRNLYRAESEKNSNLMGSLLLQLVVGSSGEVTQVNELGWRMSDDDFRKAVVTEVSKWVFQDLVPEGTTINCPLLFVREGMEITTLIRWEKTLGLFDENAAVPSMSSRPVQENKTTPTTPTPRRVKKAPASASVMRPPKQPDKQYSPNDSEAGQLLDAF